MEQNPTTETKKRTMGFMLAAELQWKLKSKADFIAYLDQHRKCLALSCPSHQLYKQTVLMIFSCTL